MQYFSGDRNCGRTGSCGSRHGYDRSSLFFSAQSGRRGRKRCRLYYRPDAKFRRRRILLLCAALLIVCAAAGLVLNQLRPAGENNRAAAKVNLSAAAASSGPPKAVVVIDPGHGGIDPGCVWGTLYESHINLSIAKKVQALLEQRGFLVLMTRTEDVDISLEERVRLANENHADLFVSIHQNSVENDTVSHGVETHCDDRSMTLGQAIQDHVIASSGAEDRGINMDANLYVVREANMPSCLVETGFLTADRERDLLTDDAYQQKLAAGIADGISAYLENNFKQLQ